MNGFYRRFVSCILVASLIVPSGPSSTPPSSADTAALSTPLTFFKQREALAKWAVLQQVTQWWHGDAALRALRQPYQRRLHECFSWMVFDAAATIAVPFIGQRLYDAAASGSSAPGSLGTMIAVSCLLVVVEGLDPLRRYIQYRLAEISSGFVADVRSYLLNQQPARAALIYVHAPSFAIRNIETPLKLPLIAAQVILSAWLLWERDAVVMGVACLTAIALAAWSRSRSSWLVEANSQLREAESDTITILERIATSASSEELLAAKRQFERIRWMEIQQTRQGLWYEGVIDRISTIILMTGVMLWGAWHQYWLGSPTTGEILTLLALSWNVQFKFSALLTLSKRRMESDSAAFLLHRST